MKTEIPAGPFAFQRADQLLLGIEHVELAADREELLLERADQVVVLVQHLHVRAQEGDAALHRQDLLAVGRRHLDVERRHALVVG